MSDNENRLRPCGRETYIAVCEEDLAVNGDLKDHKPTFKLNMFVWESIFLTWANRRRASESRRPEVKP